jgi:glycosyltransferase involved in cell wall biosynthesis
MVLCLSDIERDWLVNRVGVPPQRVLEIGCGWNWSAPRRAPQWRSPEPLRLLTVGAYARHKRIDHQIEALFRLRRAHAIDARLTVAGTLRDPGVLEELHGLVRRRGVDDAVRFMPDCEDSAIADLYATSHLFLFTSRSESFGVAVLDAIGFGTPPVIYPHPVYRSLVESSGFGTIARRSTPKALADAISSALVPMDADDESRIRWLAAHSWDQLSAPFAAWCSRLARP